MTDSQFDEVIAARERLLERFTRPTDLSDPDVMADAWREPVSESITAAITTFRRRFRLT